MVLRRLHGGGVAAVRRLDPRHVPRYEYVIAIFIPVWSGPAYTTMAFDQGIIEVAGRSVHVARHLDWLVSTPLLRIALASS